MYLQNIEDGDASFAAPVYVRGFIRTYARFLGLDPESAVAQFQPSLGEVSQPAPQPVAARLSRSRRGASPWLWLAGLAAAVLVGFVSYRYFEFQQSGPSAPATVVGIESAAPTTSAAAATPRATAKPALTRTLRLRITQDSWMSVKTDGALRLEGLVKAGTTKTFHGKTADVRAGNAGGVDLSVNGKELGKMGNAGAVVERSLALVDR